MECVPCAGWASYNLMCVSARKLHVAANQHAFARYEQINPRPADEAVPPGSSQINLYTHVFINIMNHYNFPIGHLLNSLSSVLQEFSKKNAALLDETEGKAAE